MRIAIILTITALSALAADQATVERGRKEAALACLPCHSMRIVESQRLSRATWGKEVDKMAGWGAKITDREALVEYLVANFGDDKAPSPPEISKNGVHPRKQ